MSNASVPRRRPRARQDASREQPTASTIVRASTASTSELRNAAEMHGAAPSMSSLGYHTRISSAAKAAVARLIGTDGTQEVNLTKCRPQHIRKIELAVHALPKQEA